MFSAAPEPFIQSNGMNYKVTYLNPQAVTTQPISGQMVLAPSSFPGQGASAQYPMVVDLSQMYKNPACGGQCHSCNAQAVTTTQPQPQPQPQVKPVKKRVNMCCPGCAPCCCGECDVLVDPSKPYHPQGCCMCCTGCCRCCEDPNENDEVDDDHPTAAPVTQQPHPKGCCTCHGCQVLCCGNPCCVCHPCQTAPCCAGCDNGGCCGAPPSGTASGHNAGCCGAPANNGCCGAPANNGCCGAPANNGCCGGCNCCQPIVHEVKPQANSSASVAAPVQTVQPIDLGAGPYMYRTSYNMAGFVPYGGQPVSVVPLDKKYLFNAGTQIQPYSNIARQVFTQ